MEHLYKFSTIHVIVSTKKSSLLLEIQTVRRTVLITFSKSGMYNKIYLRSFYSKFRFREILFTFSGEWGRYAPVTAAIGHEPSSLRSRRDGHRAPMTLSDTSNHTTNQRCIGDRIVETRFYPHVKNETRMTGMGIRDALLIFDALSRCAFADTR